MVLLIVCLYSPIKWRLYRLLCYILCIIINYSITLHCQPSQHKTICFDQNANYGLLMFICPQFYVSIPDEEEEDSAYIPWPWCARVDLCPWLRVWPSPAQPSPAQPLPVLSSTLSLFLFPVRTKLTETCLLPWSLIVCRTMQISSFHLQLWRFIAHLLKQFKYYLHTAYQYQKLHCLKNIFIFVFRYFCRQETLRHVNGLVTI